MKILIVGAGVIGTIYGWAFSEAGHEVVHFVRPGKAARFAGGIPIDMLDKRKGHPKRFFGRYNLKVTETLTPSDSYDWVIVPTKPYQLEEALRQIVPNTGPTDYLLLTQNWYGTASIDAILPQSRYLYGDAKAGGYFKDGTLMAAIYPTIGLGQVEGRQDERLKKAAALFAGIGINPTRFENIRHYIWVTVAIDAGLRAGLVRVGNLAALLRDRRTGDLSLQAVRECLDVVARRGVDIKKYPETRMFYQTSSLARQIAGLSITWMFRFDKSVQRTSAHALADPLEVKTAYYDLLNTGRELGVAMPAMSSFEGDMIGLGAPHPG